MEKRATICMGGFTRKTENSTGLEYNSVEMVQQDTCIILKDDDL
jgi:hypothetical protein